MHKIEKGVRFDDRYRIEKLIGSGGMAEVYLAFDEEQNEFIALKILKDDFAQDKEFVRRFLSEAEAVMSLSHDGIVRSVGFGEYDGYQYIALEYIQGQTLKEFINSHAPLPKELAVSITIQIADAMQHAHDKHIIHRDIKPQNIIMKANMKPIVTDFGIARFVDSRTQTYNTKSVMGSVYYISPEQAKGGVVNEQSDIYSLGIVLYEMLTGEVPFDNDNALTIALKHIQEKVPAPITKNAKIGPALNDVIIKATQRNPDERYQSMNEFKKALLWAMKNPKKSAKKPTKAYHQRRIMVMSGLMFVCCIALSALILFYVFNRDETTYVPNFLGKTWEEAQQEAEKTGWEIEQGSTISKTEYDTNVVAKQQPAPGKKMGKDKKIILSINEKEEWIVMPDFMQKTEAEAEAIAKELNVTIDWHYEKNDELQGVVFYQIPQSETDIEEGDIISLWIDQESDLRGAVPSVASLSLEEAIQLLSTNDFTNVWVEYLSEQDTTMPASMVIQQDPIAGEEILPTDRITLYVQKNGDFAYHMDFALNVDIEQSESNVMVVAQSGIVTTVLSERIMAAGKQQPLPVTVSSDSSGKMDIIVYVNGKEVRREPIVMKEKEGRNQ